MMNELDWELAKDHLDEVIKQYTAIGAAGLTVIRFFLNPMLVKLEKGERTQELYDEIMAVE